MFDPRFLAGSLEPEPEGNVIIPTLNWIGLAILVLLLAAGSFLVLRRRRNA